MIYKENDSSFLLPQLLMVVLTPALKCAHSNPIFERDKCMLINKHLENIAKISTGERTSTWLILKPDKGGRHPINWRSN